MAEVVHRDPADVHPDLARRQGNELFLPPGERIEGSFEHAIAELDGDDSHGGDAFFPAQQAEVLGTLGLDADPLGVQPESRRELLRHLRQVRGQARRLADHGGVHVDEMPALAGDHPHHRLQQHKARHARVARVGVREEPAQVAQGQRAERRLADRMRQHVRVRMSAKPSLGGNRHASQHQRPPGHQRVQIESEPGAHHDLNDDFLPSQSRAILRSSGVVIFMLCGGPGTMATCAPRRSTSTASSVPVESVAPCLLVRLPQEVPAERLGSLDQPQPLAVHRGLHHSLGHSLHRLAHREAAGGSAPATGRRQQTVHEIAGDERPHPVVDHDPLAGRPGHAWSPRHTDS